MTFTGSIYCWNFNDHIEIKREKGDNVVEIVYAEGDYDKIVHFKVNRATLKRLVEDDA